MTNEPKAKRKAQAVRTTEITDEILHRLSNGEPLAVICRSDVKFPHPATWGDWCARDKELAIAYAKARDVGADAIATECLQIADDANGDAYLEFTADGKPRAKIDGDNIQRAKLRIETRLKLLAKWNPKQYGERTSTEITGKDGGPVEIDDKTRTSLLGLADAVRAAKRKGAEDLI